MVVVLELLPRVAVTVAFWLLAIVAAAIALKVEVVDPAATVTEAGTESNMLLLDNATLDPPAGAVWVSVTVQVLAPLCPKLVGLHATPETSTGATRLITNVCEVLPSVAVTVALWLLVIVLDAVAMNFAVVVPAATVTEAGTVSEVLLLDSATLDPPVGAAEFRVTVQLEEAPGIRLPGLHVIDEKGETETETVAPVPATDITLPVGSTPIGLAMVIAVVPAVGASVSCTVAATPEAIVFVFDPVRTQVNKPVAEAQ
jgi:hypothetical protein